MDDAMSYDDWKTRTPDENEGRQPPEEPPPEVWDTLPVVDHEDPGEGIGYAPAPLAPVISLQAKLEQAAKRAEPAYTGHTWAVCNRSYPIRSFGECVYCQGDRNRRTTNALAEVIRELKAGRAQPDRERHLVKQLHELGHPDPKGLLDAIAARNSTAKGGAWKP